MKIVLFILLLIAFSASKIAFDKIDELHRCIVELEDQRVKLTRDVYVLEKDLKTRVDLLQYWADETQTKLDRDGLDTRIDEADRRAKSINIK